MDEQQEIEKDLELLERVEFTFALSDTSEKLENFFTNLLPPTLRKSNSRHNLVQNKVVQVLSPILKLLNLSSTTVKIPAIVLAEMFYEREMSLVTQNLTLKFLEVGVTKLDAKEQASLIPSLLKGIEQLQSLSLVKGLLRLVILLIPKANLVEPIQDTKQLDPFQSLSDYSLSFWLEKMFQFVLYGWNKLDIQPNNNTKFTYKQLQLEVLKYVSKFLAEQVRWPLKAYQIVLAGTVSSFRDNVEFSETTLKRVERPDVEDEQVVKSYLMMYLTKDAPTPLKVKLMDQFLRSRLVTSLPHFIHAVFDGINGGSSDNKLKIRSLQGMQWVIRQRDKKYIDGIAPILLAGLDKTFNQAIYSDTGREEFSIFGSCCLTVGILASKAPRLFQQNLDPLIKLFDALSLEPVVPQVRDGLNVMLEGYRGTYTATSSDPTYTDQLFAHLKSTYHDENPIRRTMSLHYLIAIFPYHHLPSRYLCVLATGDKDLTLRDLAKTGLEVEFSETQDGLGINPLEVLEYAKSDGSLTSHLPSYLVPQDGSSLIQGLPTTTLGYLLQFVYSLTIRVPLSQLRFGSTTDDSTEVHLNFLREVLQTELEGTLASEFEPVPKRLGIFVNYLVASLTAPNHSSNLSTTAAYILNQLAGCAPVELLAYLKTFVHRFDDLALNGTEEVKPWMARVYAIVVVGTLGLDELEPFRTLEPAIDPLLHTLNHKPFDTKAFSSASRILSHLLGRFHYRFPNHLWQPKAVEGLVNILKLARSRQAAHLTTLCLALQEMGRYSPLPDLKGQVEVPQGALDEELIPLALLKFIIKTTPSTKVAENALLTLGHLSVGDANYRPPAMQVLLDLPYPLNKNVEVFFRSGESIACLLGRWDCSLMRPYLDLPPHLPPSSQTSDSQSLETLLSILTEAANSATPNVRKGSAFCLLAVVQFCTQLHQLQPYYPQLHQIFLSLLTDKDDLVQEVASTGMALVFDNASELTKKRLTEEVVAMFLQGKSLAATMKGDNPVLFEADELGTPANRNPSSSSTPDTSQLTTYKSILGLAADMNQPELIYQFLALARSNAIWSSRKGAAFGLAHLLQQTQVQLDPMLPKLIPQLYRFRYDTDPKVASAMHAIWDALLPPPHKKQKVELEAGGEVAVAKGGGNRLDKYFEVIVVDLLKHVGDRSWRTRQASTLALADLLSGRKDVNLATYMERIWLMGFRALDDIKESVREAGLKCCRATLAVTLKLVHRDHKPQSQGQAILQVVLPFLLDKGIRSDAGDVQKFSLDVLLKVVTTAQQLLRPYAGPLADSLLDCLTQFEPKELNYLTFHTDKLEMSLVELERVRLSALIQSPINVALTSLVGYLKDKDTVDSVVQVVLNKIRKAPGLPTKFATAKLLVNLVTTYPDLLTSHAAKLLKTATAAWHDSSPTVRQLYSVAVGQLAPLTPAKEMQTLLTQTLQTYLNSTDPIQRSVAATTTLEMVKRVEPSTLRGVTNLLPIAFYGRFDGEEGVRVKFEEVWLDTTTSTSTATLRYQEEILQLVGDRFHSTSWSGKIQAAHTLTKLLHSLPGQVSLPTFESAFELVWVQLQGRTWEGKEFVLDTLQELIRTGKDHLNSDVPRLHKVCIALRTACRKKHLVFKTKAVLILKDTVPLLQGAYVVETFLPQVIETLKSLVLGGEMEDDLNIESQHLKPRFLVLKSYAVTSWILSISSLLPYVPLDLVNSNLVELSQGYNCIENEVWNVKLAGLTSTAELVFKFQELKVESVQKFSNLFWVGLQSFLQSCLLENKYLQLRLQVFEIVKVLFPFTFLKQVLTPILELGCKDSNSKVKDRFKELC